MTKNIFIIVILYGILLPGLCFGQTKPLQYDAIKFVESEFGDNMVYVKWYSTGQNPAPAFAPMLYTDQKPVELKTVEMLYSFKDTTFYVIQDTLTIADKSVQYPLQYFLIPHDTAFRPGNPSEIAMVAGKGNKWFTSAEAEKLNKQKGIKISWTFSDKTVIKSFRILRSNDFDKKYETLVTISSDNNSYEDLQILPDKVYYYKIMAVPLDGNKPIVSNVIFSAGFNLQPPLAPTILSSYGIKGGAVIKVKATDPETSGVRIYRNDGSTARMVAVSDLIKVPDSMIVVFHDTSLTLSGRMTYTYGAKAESSSFIESALSATAFVRPLIIDPPSDPTTFTAYYEDGMVKLFWENMEERDPGIAGYQVWRKENNPYTLLHPEYVILKVNYYNDSTIEPGKTYSYRISAVDIDGNMSASGIVASVSTPPNIPIEPSGISGLMSENGIYLSWGQTVYPDIASIRLYRYQRGTNPVMIKTLSPETVEFVDTDVDPGKLYFYYLTTVNKAGTESVKSEEIGVEN